MERIRDRGAAVERERRAQVAVDLRDQHRPGRDPRAVELGQRLHPTSIAGSCHSQCHVRFHNH